MGKQGFSLLEIIVVLTLLAIMLAAAAPVFRGAVKGNRQDQAVRNFIAALKFAQERAVADSTEYRVYIDSDGEAYWLLRLSRREGDDKMFEAPAERYAGRTTLPESLEFERPSARRDRARDAHYVAFYPNGACDYATIRFRKDKHDRLRIETKGSLGRFKVVDR